MERKSYCTHTLTWAHSITSRRPYRWVLRLKASKALSASFFVRKSTNANLECVTATVRPWGLWRGRTTQSNCVHSQPRLIPVASRETASILLVEQAHRGHVPHIYVYMGDKLLKIRRCTRQHYQHCYMFAIRCVRGHNRIEWIWKTFIRIVCAEQPRCTQNLTFGWPTCQDPGCDCQHFYNGLFGWHVQLS